MRGCAAWRSSPFGIICVVTLGSTGNEGVTVPFGVDGRKSQRGKYSDPPFRVPLEVPVSSISKAYQGITVTREP
jgi:hypothetical protein